MHFHARVALCCLLIISASSVFVSNAKAQSASQAYRVVVPSKVAITQPSEAIIEHSETDVDRPFPTQEWVINSSLLTGISVSFETVSAFTHTEEPTSKIDVQLNLDVASSTGPAVWSVSNNQDSTHVSQSDENAKVSATSTGVGQASFNLNVKLLGNDSVAAGNYEMAVVGTVVAN